MRMTLEEALRKMKQLTALHGVTHHVRQVGPGASDFVVSRDAGSCVPGVLVATEYAKIVEDCYPTREWEQRIQEAENRMHGI